MQLDRRHMFVSIVMMVLAIGYNVWVYTRPADGVGTTVAAPGDAFAPGVGAVEPPSAGGAVDPSDVKPLADVALDRLPEWPRNPFVSLRPEPAADVIETGTPVSVAVDPAPVVTTILYSADRRRAVVDGRIVGIGDKVGTATVADILPNAVLLDSPEKGRQTLALRAPGRPQ